MNFTPITEVKISLDLGEVPIPVGRLATLSQNHQKIYFEYEPSFLSKNLNISPLKLPLNPGLIPMKTSHLEGLPGVFNDSLPDGWGRLLLDRILVSHHILPQSLTALDRLTYVGTLGMGALTYEPAQPIHDHAQDHSEILSSLYLDTLAQQSSQVLEGQATEVLQELFELNGSSAGARPKAMITLDQTRQEITHGRKVLPKDHTHWLVKFRNAHESLDSGAIEYIYSLMAKEAGLTMMETHLFFSKNNPGYFATQRFDRILDQRIHTHTAAGLFEVDFRLPALDYENLIALTERLTHNQFEIEKMFRLAVFNVLAHNRDDHGKNFTFLMDKSGAWSCSPAYDLTFSAGPQGEHSTLVLGSGKKPTQKLIQLGEIAGLDKNKILEIIDQTQSALTKFTPLSKEYGVSENQISLIQRKLNSLSF